MARFEYRVIDTGQNIEAQLNELGGRRLEGRGRNHEEAATDRPARRDHLDA